MIGEPGVAGDEGHALRLRLCMVYDALVEQLERCLASSCLTDKSQLLFLGRADDGQLAHLAIGLGHDVLDGGGDAIGKTLCQFCRIDGIIVLHQNTTWLNLDVDFELRHIQFEQFLLDGLSVDLVF